MFKEQRVHFIYSVTFIRKTVSSEKLKQVFLRIILYKINIEAENQIIMKTAKKINRKIEININSTERDKKININQPNQGL